MRPFARWRWMPPCGACARRASPAAATRSTSRPHRKQAAWRHLAGKFRAFAEWATDENVALAREGLREARGVPFHNLDAKAIAEGSAAFNTIKDWFDA